LELAAFAYYNFPAIRNRFSNITALVRYGRGDKNSKRSETKGENNGWEAAFLNISLEVLWR
jgi:hypothetical protein